MTDEKSVSGKATNWILSALRENDFNNIRVYELCDKYCKEVNHITKDSFKRLVRKIALRYINSGLNTVEAEEGSDINDELIKLLEEETISFGRRLSLSDVARVASRTGHTVEEFHTITSNLPALLNNIYMDKISLKDDKIKIFRLEEQIKEIKRERDILLKEESGYYSVLQEIEKAVTQYERLPAPKFTDKVHEERAMVLLLSDLHFSETIDIEETYGINEYNISIAKDRIEYLFNDLRQTAKTLGTGSIHIQLLGDMVSGEIQEGFAGNELTVIDSILELSDFLCQCITGISKDFDNIIVNGVIGNHGRIDRVGKPYYKNKAQRNWDYVLYHFMRKELENVVDEFNIPKSPFMVDDVLGHGILLMHGDSFTGGGGWSQVPGTISRDVPRLSSLLESIGRPVYLTCMGHFHTSTSLHDFAGKQVVINGSTVGASEFSLGKLKRGAIPSQVIFCMEKDRGARYFDTIELV